MTLKYYSLLSAGIISILIINILIPKLPLFEVSKTYVAIRIEDIILLIFSVLAVPSLWIKRKVLIKDNLVLAILGFFIIGFFSTFSAIFVTQSVTPHLAILHYLRRIEYIAPFFIVLAAWPNLAKIKEYYRILILISVVVLIYGVGQMYFGFPVFSTTNKEFAKGTPLTFGPEARVNSTFAGHYDLAAYLAMIIIIFATILISQIPNLKQKFTQILTLLIITSANFWLLLQTASRISFIAYLVGISFVFLIFKKRLLLIIILIISILSLFSSSEIRARFINTFKYGFKSISLELPPKQVIAQTKNQATNSGKSATISPAVTEKPYKDILAGEPQDTTQVGVFRSSRVRFDFEWPAAIRGFLRNPILGSGYSSLGLATDNDYLRSLGEVGLAGSLAFALIFVELGKRIINFLKRHKQLDFQKALVIGFLGMIIALLVNATFIDVFEASKIAILFWTLIGILVVTLKSNETTQSS